MIPISYNAYIQPTIHDVDHLGSTRLVVGTASSSMMMNEKGSKEPGSKKTFRTAAKALKGEYFLQPSTLPDLTISHFNHPLLIHFPILPLFPSHRVLPSFIHLQTRVFETFVSSEILKKIIA